MCQYCERSQDVKFGWQQPAIDGLHGNVAKELEMKAVIHDYKSTTSELIITMPNFFPDLLGVQGMATTYIPINFCPICGRELGNKTEI